jgi:hypothetical protein
MGHDVDVYVVGARDPIVETIRMTGFHHSVVLADEYKTDTIESV